MRMTFVLFVLDVKEQVDSSVKCLYAPMGQQLAHSEIQMSLWEE
jgi:hypothetical protein